MPYSVKHMVEMSIYTAYVFVSIILHREPLRDEFENKDP
jgi:uncharacterized membrane protein